MISTFVGNPMKVQGCKNSVLLPTNEKLSTNVHSIQNQHNFQSHCTYNMDNADSIEDTERQEQSPSPSISQQTQCENEERFHSLHREVSTVKTLMEKVIEHIGEKNRPADAAPTTFSYRAQAFDSCSTFSYVKFHFLSQTLCKLRIYFVVFA